MKQYPKLAALALSFSSLSAQTNVTIHSEDFESGGTNFTGGNANMTFAIEPDPAAGAAQGMVGSGNLGGGNARWGSITSLPNSITLPLAVEAGVSSFTASMKVLYPTGTTSVPGDRTGFILRWNGVNQQNTNIYYTKDDIPADTWTDLTVTGTIPATDANGAAVTSVTIIISFDDIDNDAADGLAVYVDDFELTATASLEDPNFPNPSTFGFGDVDQNGGPVTQNLLLSNSGAINTLTITAADLNGANASLFNLSPLTLPLNIAPGASEVLQITLDPGAELGALSASLDFTSNDPTTPMATTNLTANSVEPFEGLELLVNGDFETGNLDGWRTDNFSYTETVARGGSGSGVFTLVGGNQWGETRQIASAVPGGEVGSIAITADMYGKDFFYSGWYYRPSTGGPAADDTVAVIFRHNSKNQPGSLTTGATLVGNIPTDTWTRITLAGVIPATEPDGVTPLTEISALWSFRDVNSDAVGGEIMYIDDLSFKVDVPVVVVPVDPVITNLTIDPITNDVSFDYSAVIGDDYAIERSTKMLPNGQPGGWIEIDDPSATSALETFTDSGAAATSPVYFYRVIKL